MINAQESIEKQSNNDMVNNSIKLASSSPQVFTKHDMQLLIQNHD
jgi:hypothetical protein